MTADKKFQLSTVLEQGYSPSMPEPIRPELLDTNDPESVKTYARDLVAFYYFQTLAELGEEKAGMAQRDKGARQRLLAEALRRTFTALQGQHEFIEQVHGYAIYEAARTGIFQAAADEPNTFEQWLLTNLADGEMSKANRSYLTYFYTHMLPQLQRTSTDEEIEEMFTVKGKWRRLTMSIKPLREVTDAVREKEEGFKAERDDYKIRMSALSADVISEEDPERKAQLREQQKELAKEFKEFEQESEAEISTSLKNLKSVVRAAIGVVNDTDHVPSDARAIQKAIQERIRKNDSEDEAAAKTLDRQVYDGEVLRFNTMDVWVAVLPVKAEMLMETTTRGVVDWRQADFSATIAGLLKIAPKSAKQVMREWFRGLSEDDRWNLIGELNDIHAETEV